MTRSWRKWLAAAMVIIPFCGLVIGLGGWKWFLVELRIILGALAMGLYFYCVVYFLGHDDDRT